MLGETSCHVCVRSTEELAGREGGGLVCVRMYKINTLCGAINLIGSAEDEPSDDRHACHCAQALGCVLCKVSLSLHILLSLLCSADELKELPFFHPINWLDAMNQRLKPPLVPPRGEVNAADTFDIGSFSDDDVKGVKVCWWDEGVPECGGRVAMCWVLESKGGWMKSRSVKCISMNSLLCF